MGRAARGSETEILDSAELLLWPGVCARHGWDPHPEEAGAKLRVPGAQHHTQLQLVPVQRRVHGHRDISALPLHIQW